MVDKNQKHLLAQRDLYGLADSQVHIKIRDAFSEKVPDIVLLATPPSTHLQIGKEIIQNGSNLLIEKPVGLNLIETKELLHFASIKNAKVFVDHTYMFTPAAKKIKELIRSNSLGDLQFITSIRFNLGLIREDVDVIRDLAVHDVALLDYFLQRLPENVGAVVTTHKPAKIPSTASVNLNYKNQLSAQLVVSWNSPVKIRTMIISGSEKSIIWDDTNQSEKLKIYEASANFDISDPSRYISYSLGDTVIPKLDNTEAIYLQLDHLRDVLLGGKNPINGYDHILRVNEILENLDHRTTINDNRADK